jgi:hypothetical protein
MNMCLQGLIETLIPPVESQGRSGVPLVSGRPQGKLRRGRVQICTLPPAPLPPLLFATVAEVAPHLRGIRSRKGWPDGRG